MQVVLNPAYLVLDGFLDCLVYSGIYLHVYSLRLEEFRICSQISRIEVQLHHMIGSYRYIVCLLVL